MNLKNMKEREMALDIEQAKKVYDYEVEELNEQTRTYILNLLDDVNADIYEQCTELLNDNSITLSKAIDKILELIRG